MEICIAMTIFVHSFPSVNKLLETHLVCVGRICWVLSTDMKKRVMFSTGFYAQFLCSLAMSYIHVNF